MSLVNLEFLMNLQQGKIQNFLKVGVESVPLAPPEILRLLTVKWGILCNLNFWKGLNPFFSPHPPAPPQMHPIVNN